MSSERKGPFFHVCSRNHTKNGNESLRRRPNIQGTRTRHWKILPQVWQNQGSRNEERIRIRRKYNHHNTRQNTTIIRILPHRNSTTTETPMTQSTNATARNFWARGKTLGDSEQISFNRHFLRRVSVERARGTPRGSDQWRGSGGGRGYGGSRGRTRDK